MNITKETTEAQEAPVEQAPVTAGTAILLAVTGAADDIAAMHLAGKTLTEDEHNAIQFQVGVIRRFIDEMHE